MSKRLSNAAGRALALVCLLQLSRSPGFGQGKSQSHDEHAHHAGLLLGVVHNLPAGRWMPGLGVEYGYVLPRWNRLLGIGVGAGMVFDEHRHMEEFFLAPEFEVAFAGDDVHLMLGLHFGFGF